MDDAQPVLTLVCQTCKGTGTISRPRAIIGRPGLGPRRVVRLDHDHPHITRCPECKGTPRRPVYRA